nr:alpha-L-rhamnosidase [Bifidobacterium choladohabitans]
MVDSARLEVSPVRFGHRPWAGCALGYDQPCPSLSWRLLKAPEGWKQEDVEVEITDHHGRVSVHRLHVADQICLPWPGEPLKSRESAAVRVRVSGQDGIWSPWSVTARVECGLLSNQDWSGCPVSPSDPVGREDPAPVLSRRFTVEGTCAKARIHLTAGGLFVAYLDGQRIGQDQLCPGWTDYRHRINALTYDLTDALTPGSHRLDVLLGNGWYRGHLGWQRLTDFYGDRLWLMAQLEWFDSRGEQVLSGDDQWTWHPSPISSNDLYDGECRDMRIPLLEARGVVRPVQLLPMPHTSIRPQEAPPARIIRCVPGQKIITTPSGRTVVDFGQNVAGWVRMVVRGGRPGGRLQLRHAEVLDHGELALKPLRQAKATDEYILSGTANEVVEPMFTQHGFRYVQVEGLDPDVDVKAGDFQACLVSAVMEPTASFICSDDRLNRLFENVRWSTMDNFITVPTDCPQRDERLGWTGDIAMFAPSALELFDADAFLSSWLTDVANSQAADGGIPLVVPDVLDGPRLTCGWGDAAVLVPWALYRATGDEAVLRRFLPMMDRFVDGVQDLTRRGLWQGGFQFGDWLDPDAPADQPMKSKADPDVVATAFAAHSAALVAQAHACLGQKDQEQHYRSLADGMAQGFRDEYVSPNGRILSDCPSVYSFALDWSLLETDRQRQGAGERLADLVRASGFRISTGFLGTPFICQALTISGHADLAVRLVLQDNCPGWLYQVDMGATTVWERWDSMLPDGSINPNGMTSFNHYALGSVVSWLIQGLIGLRMDAAGWRKVTVAPLIIPQLSFAELRLVTPYGPVNLSWRRQDSSATVSMHLSLPVGVSANLVLPGGVSGRCDHGDYSWILPDPNAKPTRQTRIRTIRDLIDVPDLLADLIRALLAIDSPSYRGSQADLSFCAAAKPWLDAPVGELPQVASQQGFLPDAGAIESAVAGFLQRHGLVAAGKVKNKDFDQ